MSIRDHSLDFMKGVAIVSVVLIHCFKDEVKESLFYWFHIGQAVPIFMIVTGYLAFKKNDVPYSKIHITKIKNTVRTILYPFFLIMLLQIIIKLKLDAFNPELLFQQMGLGPGSYYPWVFIQAIMILPILTKWSKKQSNGWIGWTKILIFSISFNLVLSYFEVDESIYRLLIIRYIPYLYLGCWWASGTLKFSKSVLILVIFSGIFAFTQIYLDINFKPFVFNSWRTYSWLTAPYILGIIWVLKRVYLRLEETVFVKMTVWLGKHSYSIFLTQLLVFSILRRRHLKFIESIFLRDVAFFMIGFILSFLPTIVKYVRLKRSLLVYKREAV